MRVFIIILISVVIGTLFSIPIKNLIKRINSKIWKYPKIDTLAVYLPFIAPFFAVIWIVGKILSFPFISSLGAVGVISVFLFDLLMLITLPFSWAINLINARIQSIKSKSNSEKSFDPNRRKIIKAAAAALPLFALGTTGTGLASSFQPVNIRKIPMHFDNLPDALNGFKILHLSDLHLGIYFQLSDLEKVIEDAINEKPDLFLITGDVSDDLTLLPDALRIIHQLNTPQNGFVSLGNHEYYRGVREAIQIFATSPVPLLINHGKTIKIGDSKLFIGGADDPVSLRSDITAFLNRTVEMTMKNSPMDAFRILMSHRPKSLDIAENYNIDLILSGHTHGGQIGHNGRSVFDGMIDKEPYMWGTYRKGNTRLYTSAGMGHWFPFRFNCPPEAPLIILKK